MLGALQCRRMISVHQTCPISTRPAYFGTRRIAPVAATSRIEVRGARPAVEELRPARRHPRSGEAATHFDEVFPAGTFVAHVIGQFAPREAIDPRSAAGRYAAADALGGNDFCRLAVSI